MSEKKEIRPTELTEELIDQIIFGMENQQTNYLFDIKEGELVPSDDPRIAAAVENGEESEERFVELPNWRPVDGFHLMERFVAFIKNPIYRQEMRDALNGGRGVFRRFKDVLKRYEPLERQWFAFKEREMRQVVRDWYAAVTDSIVLSRLGEEPEETEELVLSDFILQSGTGKWKERIQQAAVQAMEESVQEISTALRDYLFDTEITGCRENEHKEILYAETPLGEFAGTVLGVYVASQYSTVLDLRFIYVEPQFRGLGLSRLFIDRIIEIAGKNGVHQVVIDLLGKTLFLQEDLEERGFREFGRRYALSVEVEADENDETAE